MADDETPAPRLNPFSLVEPIAPPEKAETVVDFTSERLSRRELMANSITPETVLEMALKDCRESIEREGGGLPTRAYITLIYENEEASTTVNYRSKLSRLEEVAYRQLGLTEAMDNWRGSGG